MNLSNCTAGCIADRAFANYMCRNQIKYNPYKSLPPFVPFQPIMNLSSDTYLQNPLAHPGPQTKKMLEDWSHVRADSIKYIYSSVAEDMASLEQLK